LRNVWAGKGNIELGHPGLLRRKEKKRGQKDKDDRGIRWQNLNEFIGFCRSLNHPFSLERQRKTRAKDVVGTEEKKREKGKDRLSEKASKIGRDRAGKGKD